MSNFTKKVVIVSSYYPPHKGGLEIVVKRQAESLAKVGYGVSVLTTGNGRNKYTKTTENKVDVYRLKANNFFEDKFGIPFPIVNFKFALIAYKLISSSDIVHLNDVFYTTSWIAAIIAILNKKTLFLTQHVAIVEHEKNIVILFQKLIYTIFGDFIFSMSEKIIVYNDIVKQFLYVRRVKQNKIIELRNGIDLNFFKPVSITQKKKIRKELKLDNDKPLILFAGRLVTKKGFHKLFHARSNKYNIVMAGSGKIPKGWDRKPGVKFIGEYNYDQIIKYYQTADVFVFPAVGEIFTIVMQEAMACGLPIVTTNDIGYRKYNLNQELISLIKPKSKVIKSEILKILKNDHKYRAMRGYSLSLSKEFFNWEKNFKDHLKIYETIK